MLEIKHISELEKKMSSEDKKRSKEMYDKFYGIPFGQLDPVYCGPEARARVKGPEALKAYYKEADKYLVEVDIEDFS